MQPQRHIRSFVLRAGRMTPAQERALTELWPSYGVDLGNDPLDLKAIFGRSAPRCLEIGFGVGEVIGSLAENNPHIDYLGVEVHRPGVGRLLLRAAPVPALLSEEAAANPVDDELHGEGRKNHAG